MKKNIAELSLLVLMLAYCHASRAQPLHYNSQAELLGAAATGPWTTETSLTKVMDFCAERVPLTMEPANAALKRWKNRNGFYLYASAGYRQALDGLINDPKLESSKREPLRNLINVDLPRLVKAKTEALLEPLRVAAENGAGESLCQDYVAAIDSGDFDISRNDPQLAEFIEKNAPRNAGGPRLLKPMTRQDVDYARLVRTTIKSHLAYVAGNDVAGNPGASFKITLLPNGEVQSVEKLKGSGIPEYDQALATAISKSSPFPKKADGTVEKIFVAEFYMRDKR